ncbi:MAG: 5-dehydro-2-deoxygluconokinase [Pontimonas sp.]
MSFEVVSVGRISVDLYAQEPHAGFDQQQSFRKSVGGSPTNVAVAAARLGHNVALVTKVGDDDFGNYIRHRLEGWGVTTDYVGSVTGAQTPLAFAALTPPETPHVVFYRGEAAPDTQIVASDVPDEVITDAKIVWISQTSLAQGSTAEACLAWMGMRNQNQHTILDLDYRPTLWPSVQEAHSMAQRAIAQATVVVGNSEECEVALGVSEPDAAADALLEAGVSLAIIKMGAEGALLATANERVRVAPTPIDVVCGLGAGDAFGGALCHALLEGLSLTEMGALANAAGAHVASQLTCADAMPSLEELQAVMEETA